MSCDAEFLAAPAVRALQPYLPGKPISELEREYGVSDIVKLASNENPLGPPPSAVAALQRAIRELALYPDGGGFALRQALSRLHGIDPDRITLGNGSNDVLVLLAEAFLTPGDEAVYSQYCFAVYPIAVQATGATARAAPARPASGDQPRGHDLDAMAELIGERTRLVFVARRSKRSTAPLRSRILKSMTGPKSTRDAGKPGTADRSSWSRSPCTTS